MRRRCFLGVGVSLACSALLSACVSLKRTPDARFFVLRSLPETTSPAHASVGGLLGLHRVRLPEHLGRPQLVRWVAPSELRIDEFLRWSEPLDAGFERTLAEDLSRLLPQARLLRDPWPARSSPRCRVAVSVSVFGAQPDGSVRLEGRFALLPGGDERALVQRAFAFARAPVGAASEPAALVEAMSALVGDLAAEIAGAISALPEAP